MPATRRTRQLDNNNSENRRTYVRTRRVREIESILDYKIETFYETDTNTISKQWYKYSGAVVKFAIILLNKIEFAFSKPNTITISARE